MTWDTSLLFALNRFAASSGLGEEIVRFFAVWPAYILVALFFGLLLFSHAWRAERWRLFLSSLAAVVLARGILTPLIRLVLPRPRPFLALPVRQLFAEASSSLPSGHATFFFALAAVIFAHDRRWGTIFFVASTVMVLGRVAAGVHYPSDMIIGALIGSAVGYGVTRMTGLQKRKIDA